ncbi:unnamed protein product [Staurois parvus]|uniref:Uncharacterized protein n=1 Tax=Staurois parvus TaxID=386267 RepID=A0ABN9EH42_9NEOB|nr:unnamed protein product [Staurois parvus]
MEHYSLPLMPGPGKMQFFVASCLLLCRGGLTTHGAIGDHGAPVYLPKLKKAYEKGTRGISLGPY